MKSHIPLNTLKITAQQEKSIVDCVFNNKTKPLQKVTHITAVLMFGSAINYAAFAQSFFTYGVISLSYAAGLII
jgi:hypothetical protein